MCTLGAFLNTRVDGYVAMQLSSLLMHTTSRMSQTMANHCTNCGHELRDGDKFCANCGATQAGVQSAPQGGQAARETCEVRWRKSSAGCYFSARVITPHGISEDIQSNERPDVWHR